MEAFFERETQRVGFSSGRTAARAAAKRESMTAASAELTKVCLYSEVLTPD